MAVCLQVIYYPLSLQVLISLKKGMLELSFFYTSQESKDELLFSLVIVE